MNVVLKIDVNAAYL